jgi:outer membrane protein TolC
MKYLTCLLLMLFWALPLQAAEPTITDLLNAAARQPELKAGRLAVQGADAQLKKARAALFPKLTAFGSYEIYNSPTNLRPMPPTEVNVAAGESIPFSRRIARYGVSVEMPLFVKELYGLADKVKELKKSSRAQYRIELLTRQAQVVSLDAALAFNAHLNAAIDARLASLRKTRDDIELAVSNGRAAESELLKVETASNDLQKQKNDLARQALVLTSQIEQLTGVRLNRFVGMTLQRPVAEGSFLPQTEQQAKVAAAEKDLQQVRDRHYPSLKLEGFVSENRGEAYNTDRSIGRSYDYIGVKISVPLFDRSLSTAIDQADIQLRRQKEQLAQLRIDLTAEAQSLKGQLKLIGHSAELARTTLSNHRRLLGVAKVAYRNGRITTEDYLRYEAQVLEASAALYQTQVDRWQVISRQAVLFGDELTGVVQ